MYQWYKTFYGHNHFVGQLCLNSSSTLAEMYQLGCVG